MRAAASLYGVGIITDKEDLPHLLLDKIKGELYYHRRDRSKRAPKADAKYELKVFPRTHHGFCFPERAVTTRWPPKRPGARSSRCVGP